MTWTTDKPTTPGFYWMKADGMRSRVIEITEDDHHGLSIIQTGLSLTDIPDNDRAWGLLWFIPLSNRNELHEAVK